MRDSNQTDLNDFLEQVEAVLGVVTEKIGRKSDYIWNKGMKEKCGVVKDVINRITESDQKTHHLERVGLSGSEFSFKFDAFHKHTSEIKIEIEELDNAPSDLEANWLNKDFRRLVREYWDEIKSKIKKILSIINSVLKTIVALCTGVAILALQSIGSQNYPITAQKAVDAAWAADSISEFKDILESFID